MGIEAFIVLLLIVANGLLSMSELAVVSSRSARLQQLADRGNRGATVAMQLAAEPNRFLSTVQIGITLIGILTGLFGGEAISLTIAEWLQGMFPAFAYSGVVGKTLAVALITFLTLIFGELV
ncbi:MAG TPA: CNNM domain-containing protein, partial [Thermomicrobiales bacterium]|nr:CNNM domain-containing protein [Thermomicrobiales bacterium]